MAASPFTLLPTEVQCSIIRILDPISLISLSQSSSYFRRLINPQKRHFVERLLALELIPSYGGPIPTSRSREHHVADPGPLDPEWDDMRWACTDCLRLLSQDHFDGHSVLRLRYRKPSSAIYGPISTVSTWEPTGDRSTQLSKKAKRGALAKDKKQRQWHTICVEISKWTQVGRHPSDRLDALQACGMPGFERMTQDEFSQLAPKEKERFFDENAFSIERARCGIKRHHRKCNECRYQRRQLPFQSSRSGETCAMPILPNRQFPYATSLDRWLPGLSDNLENKHPGYSALMSKVIRNRNDRAYRPPTRYMARCPGCARWQELRNFRTRDYNEIDFSLPDSSRCNSCFALANGVQELGRVLLEWFDFCLADQLDWLAEELKKALTFRGPVVWGMDDMPRKYRREVKYLIRTTPCLFESWDHLSYYDVAELRLRQTQWKDIWERMKADGDTGWESCDMDEWYEESVREFDEVEEQWRWTMRCEAELAERPEALVEWALSGGPEKPVQGI